jgi:pyruvate-formate lyase
MMIMPDTRTASAHIGRRLAGLRSRCAAVYGGARIYWEDGEYAAYTAALIAAYEETAGQGAILRRARALERFAAEAVVDCPPGWLIAGSQRFCGRGGEAGARLAALGWASNCGHIVHDYAVLLDQGVGGLRLAVASRRRDGGDAATLAAFDRALAAFQRFIARHAEAAADPAMAAMLGGLAAGQRPAGFHQALQLAWFMQVFLHAENPAAAISFGRLDQCLWPFLRRDLETGRLDRQQAFDLVAEFFLCCCAGDESQNLTLGGVDAAGEDATNPLSLLMLEVMADLGVEQPSLSVRLHPASPAWFVDAACALAATGTGQPAFLNDGTAIPALMAAGLPQERARDYGIVGCYEPTAQGDCYPNTVAGSLNLARLLAEHLASAEGQAAAGPDALLAGWFARVETAYAQALAGPFQRAWDHWRDLAPSPFGSVLLGGCLDAARPLEAGGARFTLFGVNLLGLGTVVDSLHAIDQLVFARRELTLAELAAACAGDHPDEALRRRLRACPGRYGSDSAATNRLTAVISERCARLVLDSRMAGGVRPYPALFKWTGDIWEHDFATPDGRRRSENLSYGCGPASAAGGAPTALLASATHAAHHLCGCGSPLALSLPAEDVRGADGLTRLRALVLGYFSQGGAHLHLNLRSAETLRAAIADPETHRDLLIRMSGLSARFAGLARPVQDALVERAEAGV